MRLELPGTAGLAPRRQVILTVLATVFVLSGLNAMTASVHYAFNFRYGTYLAAGDTIADFAKLVLSYPGAREVPVTTALARGYVADNPYGGPAVLAAGGLTHFHLPPLTTTLALASLGVMKLLGPETTYGVVVVLLAAAYVLLVREVVRGAGDRLLLALALLLSYPFLFMLQRGNAFAALAALCVSWGLVLLRKRKATLVALILLAVAVNIRPNVALLAAPILVWTARPVRNTLVLGVLVAGLFAGSLRIAGAVYPAYSLSSFLRGLEIYHRMFVIGPHGAAFSTSLYTFARFVLVQAGLRLKHLQTLEVVLSALAAGVVLLATWRRRLGRLGDAEYVFVITAAGMLGTAVFGDYHLLTFAAPLLVALVELEEAPPDATGLDRRLLVVVWGCAFLLAPKNYLNVDGVYVLAFTNTLLCAGLVVRLLRRPAGAPVEAGPAPLAAP
jgi:hypothetical protein